MGVGVGGIGVGGMGVDVGIGVFVGMGAGVGDGFWFGELPPYRDTSGAGVTVGVVGIWLLSLGSWMTGVIDDPTQA